MPTASLSLAERVRGCLLGGAVGDALGAPVEFWSLAKILDTCGPLGVKQYLPTRFAGAQPLGLITDDTQMTLFTAEALMDAGALHAGANVADVYPYAEQSYLRWLDTQEGRVPSSAIDAASSSERLAAQAWLYSLRAPGNTCMTALRALRDRGMAPAENASKGCGTVMRCAPVGLLVHASLTDVADLAASLSYITHGHPTAAHASGALAAIVHTVAGGGTLRAAVASAVSWLDGHSGAGETRAAVQQAVLGALEEPGSRDRIRGIGEGWIAEEALGIALFAAMSYPGKEQALDALSLAVTHDGDSDSTGAICGNIIGALHGERALPVELAEQVEGRAEILALADAFALGLQPA